MIMGLLRPGTLYSTQARIFSDSNQSVTIQWSLCQPHAKFFPGIHRFGSLVWDPGPYGEVSNDLGEVIGARRVHRPPPYVSESPGKCFIGDPDWYVHGMPIAALRSDPPPRPDCCPPVSVQSRKGGTRGSGGMTLNVQPTQTRSGALTGGGMTLRQVAFANAEYVMEFDAPYQLGLIMPAVAYFDMEFDAPYQLGLVYNTDNEYDMEFDAPYTLS
jgi:hypothetical protein